MTARTRRLVAALLALALAWLVAPGAVPIFDGISSPDEPYRYVVPPAGYKHTPQALSAKGSSPVSESTNENTIYLNTDEIAPQVNVVIPNRLLAVATGVRTVTVTATPLAPDTQPSKGTIDGNLYRVSVTGSPPGSVSFAPPPGDAASVSDVTMRATTARRPIPSFLYRSSPSQPWQVEKTFISGNDIYSTLFAGFGDYALAFGAVAPVKGSSHLAVLLSVLLAVVLLAAGTVVAVRVSRRRQGADRAS